MSWDLFVVSLPKGVKSLSDLPADHVPKPLGSRARVVKSIRSVFNGLPLDEEFVAVEVQGGSIGISLGDEDPVACVGLSIRGDDAILPVVGALVKAMGGGALDPASESGIFDPKAVAASLAAHNAYVEHVMATQKSRSGTKIKATAKKTKTTKTAEKSTRTASKKTNTKKSAAKPKSKAKSRRRA